MSPTRQRYLHKPHVQPSVPQHRQPALQAYGGCVPLHVGGGVYALQTPSVQVSVPQHWPAPEQVWPVGKQTHWPVTQLPSQQSELALHAPPTPPQLHAWLVQVPLQQSPLVLHD